MVLTTSRQAREIIQTSAKYVRPDFVASTHDSSKTTLLSVSGSLGQTTVIKPPRSFAPEKDDVSHRLLAAMTNVENQLSVNQKLRSKLAVPHTRGGHQVFETPVKGANLIRPGTVEAKSCCGDESDLTKDDSTKENAPTRATHCGTNPKRQSAAAVPSRHVYNAMAAKSERYQELKEREKKVLEREKQLSEQEGVLSKRRHSLVLLARNLGTCSSAGNDQQSDVTERVAAHEQVIADAPGADVNHDSEDNMDDAKALCDEYDCDWSECTSKAHES